nr:MAG TPA: hypothetical protein [Caudoviricetes sp.]
MLNNYIFLKLERKANFCYNLNNNNNNKQLITINNNTNKYNNKNISI